MTLALGIDEWRKCQACGVPLALTATNRPKRNHALCPRCEFMVENNIDPDNVEIRDMSVSDRSRIVVPRLEYRRSP